MKIIASLFFIFISVGAFARVTPTIEVPQNQWPNFSDDLDFDAIELALERQIDRFSKRSMKGSIKFGNKVFPRTALEKTLHKFKAVVEKYKSCKVGGRSKKACMEIFNQDLRNEFFLFKPKLSAKDPRYRDKKQTLFTAYYTPLYKASKTRKGRFQYAIYAMPQTASLRNKTREEIDFEGALDGKGYAMFYVEDLFDLYILHVQGGGRVEVDTPSGPEYYYLSYAGTNKKTWRFISHHMRKRGYIQSSGILAQKEFLTEHPDLQREIYSTCPSYVFFKLSDTPPEGSDLVPLTDGRTIATDTKYYRTKGVLSFIQAKKPVKRFGKGPTIPLDLVKFSRFALDQDTGGAIRGKARVDIYFGEGRYAELAASTVTETGHLYFLVAKSFANKK